MHIEFMKDDDGSLGVKGADLRIIKRDKLVLLLVQTDIKYPDYYDTHTYNYDGKQWSKVGITLSPKDSNWKEVVAIDIIPDTEKESNFLYSCRPCVVNVRYGVEVLYLHRELLESGEEKHFTP